MLRLAISLTLLLLTTANGAVRDIERDRLPHDSEVQSALQVVQHYEPCIRNWTAKWRCDESKGRVVAEMKGALASLQKSADEHPENAESQLLLGLAAHYAYNVDVEDSFQLAERALKQATALLPQDVRPTWFLGIHKCQTNQSSQGMGLLLALEASRPQHDMPPDFWDDYRLCATITFMPAHVLRTANYATNDPPAKELLIRSARSRFLTIDMNKEYPAQDSWLRDSQDDLHFTASACGLRVTRKGNWNLQPLAIQHGTCSIIFGIGPFDTGAGGQISPSILVLARPAKQGESLQDFLSSFKLTSGTQPLSCPVPECIGAGGFRAGAYKAAGDGIARAVAFGSNEPEIFGLKWEKPQSIGQSNDNSMKVKFYRPSEQFARMHGTMYYLVLLDTASRVQAKAEDEYKWFLQKLEIE